MIGSGAAGAALTWRLASQGARGRVPGAGRLAAPGRFASERHDFEASLRRGTDAFSRATASGRRTIRSRPPASRAADHRHVQRRRRQHRALGGPLPAAPPVRLPRPLAGRRRRRLADRVRGPRAVLRPQRRDHRRVRAGRRSGQRAARSPRPTPPLPLGRSGEALVRGFEKLGWHWWPSDNAILSRDYDGRTGCDNRGRCNFGCPLRAKASTDVTYWPKALRRGARLRDVGARARDHGRRATAARTASCTSTARARCTSSRRAWSWSAATGSARRACCWTRRSRLFPDGLANARARWAGTS